MVIIFIIWDVIVSPCVRVSSWTAAWALPYA